MQRDTLERTGRSVHQAVKIAKIIPKLPVTWYNRIASQVTVYRVM